MKPFLRALGRISLLMLLAISFSGGQIGRAWLPQDQRVPLDLSGTLQKLNGSAVELTRFEEDVLLVNFWATWCGPCLAEMPSMEALHQKLQGRSLRIVAISDEDPGTVGRFLKQQPYTFTILLDQNGSLSERLGIWSIPWTLVLDSRRRLVHFHQGARLWDSPDILESLDQLLRE